MNTSKKPEQRVITKEKRVPAKVEIGYPPNIDFVPGRALLKDSIQVIVTDGVNLHSWTIHRPIGITGLDHGDWVMTPSGDIPDLLSRTKNDDAGRIAQLRGRYRLELAVEGGILFKNPDATITYDKEFLEVRDDIVKAARNKAEAHNTDALVKYKKANPDGKEPPEKVPYQNFLSKEIFAKEASYQTFSNLKTTVEKVEGKYPDDFCTASGPKWDRKQAPATHDGVYPNRAQAMDGLVYQIDHMCVAGYHDVKTRYETGEWAENPNNPVKSAASGTSTAPAPPSAPGKPVPPKVPNPPSGKKKH